MCKELKGSDEDTRSATDVVEKQDQQWAAKEIFLKTESASFWS